MHRGVIMAAMRSWHLAGDARGDKGVLAPVRGHDAAGQLAHGRFAMRVGFAGLLLRRPLALGSLAQKAFTR